MKKRLTITKKKRLTITIKKRNQPEWLMWLIIMMPFAFGTMFQLLALPSALKYLLDVAWVFLLILLLLNKTQNPDPNKKGRILHIWITLFFLFTLISYVCNFQSVFYYVWGLRNNFRFYIAFIAFTTFMKKEDISHYLNIFDKLFWVNAVVSLIQYFVFDIYGDWLGGIFGTESGCNSYTNLFFVIISAKSIVYYLHKEESFQSCIAKIAVMMIISALAEIKFFYMEFILIVAAAVLLEDFSWRKLLIVVGGILGVLAGAYLLVILFPTSAGFLSLERIFEIASSEKGYTASGDINRLTAIPIVSKRFLTTLPKKLFGLGLGNCDTAGYHFLVTPFYTRYSYLRYQWFSTAFVFLETGFVGLLFFYLFFVLVFTESRRNKALNVQEKMYGQVAGITALCCILVGVYNAGLRTEAGYMTYFILSLPFIRNEKPQNDHKVYSKKLPLRRFSKNG